MCKMKITAVPTSQVLSQRLSQRRRCIESIYHTAWYILLITSHLRNVQLFKKPIVDQVISLRRSHYLKTDLCSCLVHSISFKMPYFPMQTFFFLVGEGSESPNERVIPLLEFILEPSHPKPFLACFCGSALASLRLAVSHSSSVAVHSCFHHSLPVIKGQESDKSQGHARREDQLQVFSEDLLMCYSISCLFFFNLSLYSSPWVINIICLCVCVCL